MSLASKLQIRFILSIALFITITSVLLVQFSDVLFPMVSIRNANQIPHVINLSYCDAIIHTDPHFVNSSERQLKLRHEWPPYLISFGGSGNSYVRLIIEDVTLLLTGAIYKEPVYQQLGFAGKECTDKVVAVKAHPYHIMQHKESFLNGTCICACDKRIHRKYLKHNPHRTNHTPWMNVSAVFLIRDPWLSAFSAMQMAHGEPLDSEFDGGEFDKNDVFKNIHTRHLQKQSQHTHPQIAATIIAYIKAEWMQPFQLMQLFDAHDLEYVVIRLESFVSHNESIALHEWKELFGFVLDKQWMHRHYKTLRQRMECVQLVGDKHDRMRLIHRHKMKKDEEHLYFSIEEVYDLIPPKHLCMVWKRIKQNAQRYQYQKWNRGLHNETECV